MTLVQHSESILGDNDGLVFPSSSGVPANDTADTASSSADSSSGSQARKSKIGLV